ncbi:MAG: hypothetical protein ACRD0K_04520 [Egibacteraceae bacterium]
MTCNPRPGPCSPEPKARGSLVRRRDQAQAADPTASTAGYDQAIADAHQRLRGVSGQVADLRGRRQAAESAAVGRLEDAQDLGVKNDPWYKRAWDAVDRWVDEHADILRGLSNILKTGAGIAGVLSLIPFLAPIFGPIALIAGGAALLLDAALAATGNGDWKTLLVDAALMALPGAGRLLSGAARGGRALSTAGRAGRALRKAGQSRLPSTGVARFDRLVHGTKTYTRWAENMGRRGLRVIEKTLEPGNAANVLNNQTVEIDPRQFRYIDLLHESRPPDMVR